MKTRHIQAAANVLNRMQANPDWARDVRSRAQLTVEEMARLCEVDKGTISRWETAQSMPTDEKFGVYASLLDRWAGNSIIRGSSLTESLSCKIDRNVCSWEPTGPNPESITSSEALEMKEQAADHREVCPARMKASDQTRISIVPIKKADGSPQRFMIRCNDCLSVPKGEFTRSEAESLVAGHSCADTVDLGTPSVVQQ